MERHEIPRRGVQETAAMDRWVRELSPAEQPALGGAGTGEVLPDGEVVLREDDIDRMGLRSLRQWLAAQLLDSHHPIALVPSPRSRPRITDVDDDDGAGH